MLVEQLAHRLVKMVVLVAVEHLVLPLEQELQVKEILVAMEWDPQDFLEEEEEVLVLLEEMLVLLLQAGVVRVE